MNTAAPSSPSSPRRRSPWVRVVVVVLILSVLWVGFGFLGLPPIIRSQAEKRLSAELKRPVKITRVKFNPLILSAQVEGLSIGDGNGGLFVGWSRLYVNFDLLARLGGVWKFSDIELDGFSGHIARNAQGIFNFADLLENASTKPSTADEKKGAPPIIAIDRLAVRAAQLKFNDLSQGTPFATDVGPMTFTLLNFRTAGETHAPHSFMATTETGETLTWNGTLSLDPLRSVGEFAVTQISLPKYAPYYENRVSFALRHGSLSVNGKYEADFDNHEPHVKLIDGGLTLQGLQISPRDSTAARVSLNDIAVTGIQANLATQEATIARVHVAGGQIAADRTANGIDLLALLAIPPSKALASGSAIPTALPPAPGANPPHVTLSELVIEGVGLALTDRTLAQPAVVAIEQLNAVARNLKVHALDQPSPVEVSVALMGGGEATIKGTVSAQPLKANAAVTATKIPLTLGSPYLEANTALRLARGFATLHGEIAFAENAATFTGETKIEEFSLIENERNEPFTGWSSLAIKGIKVVSQPLSAEVGEIAWSDLAAHVVIQSDGKLNLTALASPPGTPESTSAPVAPVPVPAPSAKPATPLPPITVGKVVLERAKITFTDRSMKPAAESVLSKLEGTIEGLSSTNVARGDVKLKGVVNDTAPVEISGRLNPLGSPAFADVKVDFQDIELSPLAPYVAKYAGYSLERGALSLAIQFKLNDRKIDSSDVATLEQFTLGEKTNSPDAVKLPITLAIALLKDRSGRIVVDLPIQGSLDDPNFRIGRVVWRVLGNLLAKVATSPFALLGSMFGGGGEELAFQSFAPGEPAPLETEGKKLATVTKALANRPTLRLDLAGSFDPVKDHAALQRIEIENQIRTHAQEERRSLAPGSTALSLDSPVTEEERTRILEKMHLIAFPEIAQAAEAARIAAAAAVEPPVEPVRASDSDGGFFKRMRRLFGRSDTETKPAEAKPAAVSTDTPAPPPVPTFTPQEITARLAAKVKIDDNDLKRLANSRAQGVRAQMVQSGDVAPERVFVVAPVGTGSRVELRLK